MGDVPRDETDDARRARWRRRQRLFLGLGCAFVFLNPCTVAIVIRVGFFEAFAIDGPAGAPAYQNGDQVVVSKTSFGLFLPFANEALVSWGEPDIGDVVIARSPADDIDIIKRVVGLPGDTIAIRDDVLYRNGEPVPRTRLGPSEPDPDVSCWRETLGDASYVVLEHDLEIPDHIDPIVLPEGHVYLLGDNRDRSADSRWSGVGPVPIERLKGRVMTHYVTAPERVVCPAEASR